MKKRNFIKTILAGIMGFFTPKTWGQQQISQSSPKDGEETFVPTFELATDVPYLNLRTKKDGICDKHLYSKGKWVDKRDVKLTLESLNESFRKIEESKTDVMTIKVLRDINGDIIPINYILSEMKENHNLDNIMREPIKVAPEYLEMAKKLIPADSFPQSKIPRYEKDVWASGVKKEFKIHLENDNWQNDEYRKQNKIVTHSHPITYYKTSDGFIVNEHSRWANYEKDVYAVSNILNKDS